MEEIKSQTASQFKILESSQKDSKRIQAKNSTKINAKNRDSGVQKHVSYIEQRLETIRDMKYDVQEMMINNNVEYEIVGKWVNMTKYKIERYQELID